MSSITDIKLPNINTDDLGNEKYVKKITNYLMSLEDSLRYMFNNLDGDNFTDSYIKVINDKVNTSVFNQTASEIRLEVSNLAEETAASMTLLENSIRLDVSNLSEATAASISLLEDEIDLRVERDGIIAAINFSPETIKIEAPNIKFEGLVTANNYFKILEDGSIEAINGKFSGKLTSFTANGKIEIDGGNIQGWDAQGTTMLVLDNMGTITCQDIICLNSVSIDGSPAITVDTLLNYSVGYATSAGTAEYASSAGSTASSAKTYEVAGVAMPYNNSLSPLFDASIVCGSSAYRWSSVYAVNGTIQTSDRNKKDEINFLDEKYLQFARMIIPRKYIMLEGTSGRTHVGFIAQEVEEAMTACGITDMDFAGLVKTPKYRLMLKDEDGNDTREYDTTSEIVGYDYALRYDEFIPLLFACML